MSYPKSCPHLCILLWESTLNLSFCPRVRGAASADNRMGTEPQATSPEGPAGGEAWCGEKCSWKQPSGEAGLWDSIQWRASNPEVHVWEQNLEREASFDHWYSRLLIFKGHCKSEKEILPNVEKAHFLCFLFLHLPILNVHSSKLKDLYKQLTSNWTPF